MRLGEIIKRYRVENNITTEQLALKCGLSKGYISMLENNFKPSGRKKDITPSIQAVRKLSKGMNMNFDMLLASIDGEVSLIPLKEESIEFNLTEHERNHLNIYRSLDDKGQHTVDTVTQMEYERVKKEKSIWNFKDLNAEVL